MKTLLLIFPLVITIFGNSCFDKKEESFSTDFSSSSPVKSNNPCVDLPKKEDKRYIIYGNDESTYIDDALTIYPDTQYSYYFNDHNDDDYFLCYLTAGSIISVHCNKDYELDIYRISGSNIVQRFNTNYVNDTKLVMDSSATYCFVITGSNNYTGRYTLEITTYTVTNFLNNYHYVNLKYANNKLISSCLKNFNDFSSLPTVGYKSGFCGTYNNNQFDTSDYVNGVESLYTYGINEVSGYHLDFINNNSGVYDSNNVGSFSTDDDNRRVFNYNTYVASAIPLITCTFVSNNQDLGSGTAFYVDQNYAFTCGHNVYRSDLFCFASSFTLMNAKHPDNTSYNYSIPCIELYLPYDFIYFTINNTFPETRRQYDWAVLKIDSSVIPSTYIHSYLGLKYPCDTSKTHYNYGYPGYTYTATRSIAINNDPDLLQHRILAGMSGSIYVDNGLIKTYMDQTQGHSGGPCLYINDSNLGIAVGIVSGYGGTSGNIYSPINKYNFAILNKYLNGTI